MIEKKLAKAAAALPLPRSDFETVTARVTTHTPAASYRRLRPALVVLAIVIALCGCSAVVTEARKAGQIVQQSDSWGKAQARANASGLVMQQKYGDFTFHHMTVFNMVPLDLPWIMGFFYPGYHTNNIIYMNPTDGSTCYTLFGEMEDEFLIQCFGYESREQWGAAGEYETVEYEGFLIHTGILEGELRAATWIDSGKGICFRVALTNDLDPLPIAMEIIDDSN